MNEEVTFDTNEDILFQIGMMIYERHNDRIASINDHLGEMYSYRDLEDAERAELEDEKHLLEIAVTQLQKENKRLKEALEVKSYCKYANQCNEIYDCSKEEYNDMCEANMRLCNEKDDLQKQLQQKDEVIEESMEIAKNNWSNCIYCEAIAETLTKYKGDNNE